MNTDTDYTGFLASKAVTVAPSGFEIPASALNSMLFPFQRDIVRWALLLESETAQFFGRHISEMATSVIRLIGENGQIGRVAIGLILVDVVDNLFGCQRPTENSLCHSAVNVH